MFDLAETENDESSPGYQVLARRTRPQSFSQLVGQDAAVKAIEGMIQSGRIPHAFLFTGTRGTGKTSSARILAKSLCCVNGPTLHPCQTCTHCVQITACAHEDVLEIDGASHTGVDNIRELREAARFFPQSSRYKIFIIDEVHMLSIGAFNALLKTLEEPPPQVIFILATTELHKVPVTVRSRCMILSFRKIDPAAIAKHLAAVLEKDRISYSADALQLIAREAKGSLRDSLSLLEQVLAMDSHQTVSFEAANAALSVMGEGICQSLFQGILSKDVQKCLEAVAEIDTASLDFSHILEQTSALFRNAVVLKQAGADSTRIAKANEVLNLLPAELELIQSASQHASVVALIEIYRALSHASREILKTNSQRAWAEMTVMDCISRSEWLSSDDFSLLLTQGAGLPGLSGLSGLPPVSEQAPAKTPTPSMSAPKQSTQPTAQTPRSDIKTTSGESDLQVPNTPAGSDMFELYATLIAHVQKQNLQLAIKLKHAKLTQFNKQKLVFTDCPENKLFAQLSEPEADIFLSSLSQLGYGDCHIEGLDLPTQVAQKRLAENSTKPRSAPLASDSPRDTTAPANGKNTVPLTSKPNQGGKALEAIASLSREDPFGTRTIKAKEQKKNETAPTPPGDEGISLASVEQAEEAKKWQARQSELRAKPLVKKLESLGAEVEVLPLKGPQRRS